MPPCFSLGFITTACEYVTPPWLSIGPTVLLLLWGLFLVFCCFVFPRLIGEATLESFILRFSGLPIFLYSHYPLASVPCSKWVPFSLYTFCLNCQLLLIKLFCMQVFCLHMSTYRVCAVPTEEGAGPSGTAVTSPLPWRCWAQNQRLLQQQQCS